MDNKAFDRFFSKVDISDQCWNWLGSNNGDGYGQIWFNGRMVLVHRICFEHFNHKIPDGMVIDHKCRNRSCVNPNHLQVVTLKENIQLGIPYRKDFYNTGNRNIKRTHCKRGHEFTQENLVKSAKGRMCRTCHNAYNREYSRKNWRKYQIKATPIVVS